MSMVGARMVVGTTILAASLWVAPAPATACSCAEFTDREHFDRASVVFVGTVVDDWSQPPPTSGEYSSDRPRWFTFATTEVYKGDVYAAQSIRTDVNGGACGMELSGSGPYLVFGVGEADLTRPGAGEFRSGLCAGNRASGVAPIPDEFGQARAPLVGASPSTRPDLVAPTTAPLTPAPTTPEPTGTTAVAVPSADVATADSTIGDGGGSVRPVFVSALFALTAAGALGGAVALAVVRRRARLRRAS